MSLDATRWAWLQPLPATDKIILLRLADRANDQNVCFPSGASLAGDCGLCERSVRRTFGRLVAAGLIDIQHQTAGGLNTRSRYTLNLSAGAQPSQNEAATESALHDSVSSSRTHSPRLHDSESHKSTKDNLPRINQSTAPPISGDKPEAVAKAFAWFWDNYPRKSGRTVALLAFREAAGKAGVGAVCAGLQRLLPHFPNKPSAVRSVLRLQACLTIQQR